MADYQSLNQKLSNIVGEDFIHSDPIAMKTYDCDALTLYKGTPIFVVLPETSEQVSEIVKVCLENEVPIIARGAGTCLSGGATPVPGGVLIVFTRMNKILELDFENRLARVQPGVVNLELTKATLSHGFHYAPDPSSQMACTIGGNVAENSGGAHCLKYGMTTNHVLGMKVVLSSGEILQIGSDTNEVGGIDLRGFFIGSEGTFGIITEVIVRLTPNPAGVKTMLASFEEVGDACRTVSDIIASGAVPAAMELMDKYTIEAIETVVKAGYPKGAAAVLLIELDGFISSMQPLEKIVKDICELNSCASFSLASDEREREDLWMGRKKAFGAFGAISPSYYCLDGTVPRSKLAQVLEEFENIGKKFSLRITNVFHAGDGSLHPNVLFDENVPGEVERAVDCGSEILRACIRVGGVLSGEHGIGIEKIREMRDQFDESTLDTMDNLRSVIDPIGFFNPGKVIPNDEFVFPISIGQGFSSKFAGLTK